MQEYEYLSYEICMPRAEQEKEVSKMAGQGWRLVSVAGYVFWFERRLTLRAPDACPAGGEHEFSNRLGEIYIGGCNKCGKRR